MRKSSARLLFEHRRLLWRVTRVELRVRYAGSLLGAAWTLIGPLLVLAVYAVVYLFVFRVRPPGMDAGRYVLYLFAGLVPYLMSAEAIALGVAAVVSNRNAMTSTVFLIDLNPVRAVLLAQGTAVAGFTAVLVAAGVAGALGLSALLLPVLWLLLLLFLTGVNWFLSLVTVVFRDLQHLVSVLLMVLLVASPIAYTPDMMPARFRLLVQANPLAPFIVGFQKILVLGTSPTPGEWLTMAVLSLGVFCGGSWFFTRVKGAMVDYV
jgi:lipopolysaccharide transport system permease protein